MRRDVQGVVFLGLAFGCVAQAAAGALLRRPAELSRSTVGVTYGIG
ncbi:hypothetical protein [Streptomyces sp. NPDC006012]